MDSNGCLGVGIANSSRGGVMQSDETTISCNSSGVISVKYGEPIDVTSLFTAGGSITGLNIPKVDFGLYNTYITLTSSNYKTKVNSIVNDVSSSNWFFYYDDVKQLSSSTRYFIRVMSICSLTVSSGNITAITCTATYKTKISGTATS